MSTIMGLVGMALTGLLFGVGFWFAARFVRGRNGAA
jgi:hypothetical protein